MVIFEYTKNEELVCFLFMSEMKNNEYSCIGGQPFNGPIIFVGRVKLRLGSVGLAITTREREKKREEIASHISLR